MMVELLGKIYTPQPFPICLVCLVALLARFEDRPY